MSDSLTDCKYCSRSHPRCLPRLKPITVSAAKEVCVHTNARSRSGTPCCGLIVCGYVVNEKRSAEKQRELGSGGADKRRSAVS